MNKYTCKIPFKTEKGRISCNERLKGGGKDFSYDDLIFNVNDGIEDDMRIIQFRVDNERPCAIVHLETPVLATLQVFEFGTHCAKNRKMKRGKDTRKMLLGMKEYLKQIGVKNIQFVDNSFYMCDGINIPLRISYLLCYGKTWYDDIITCEPLDKDIKQSYNAIKEKLATLKWNTVRSQLRNTGLQGEILESIPERDILFTKVVDYLRTEIPCKLYLKLINIFLIYITEGETFEGVVFISSIV